MASKVNSPRASRSNFIPGTYLVDYLVVFSVGDMRRKHVILGSAVSS